MIPSSNTNGSCSKSQLEDAGIMDEQHWLSLGGFFLLVYQGQRLCEGSSFFAFLLFLCLLLLLLLLPPLLLLLHPLLLLLHVLHVIHVLLLFLLPLFIPSLGYQWTNIINTFFTWCFKQNKWQKKNILWMKASLVLCQHLYCRVWMIEINWKES